jgi:hypothetical protein
VVAKPIARPNVFVTALVTVTRSCLGSVRGAT